LDLPCFDLLNSEYHDYRGSGAVEDRLDDPRWLERFMARWGYDAAGEPGGEVRAALARLRGLLRRAVRSLAAGGGISDADLAELNEVLASERTVQRVVRAGDGYEVERVAIEESWRQVVADIAASFAGLLAEGDPDRIKICDNPDCKWVFYDESRNRSRRWCENTCGNLMKVRRFRARKRSAAGKPRPER